MKILDDATNPYSPLTPTFSPRAAPERRVGAREGQCGNDSLIWPHLGPF